MTASFVPGEQNGCGHADFFCGEPNAITFPCCSDGIHLVAFFLKLLGT
jgi:hypothetical protein